MFVDLWEMPDKQPNGEAWEIRTYPSLRELVPLLEPERDGSYVGRGEEDIVLRPFPLIFRPRIEVPSRDDWPFQRFDVYDRHSDALDEFHRGGLKVGGWPHTIQSDIDWGPGGANTDTEFVLPVDSDEKAPLWIGDASTMYIVLVADGRLATGMAVLPTAASLLAAQSRMVGGRDEILARLGTKQQPLRPRASGLSSSGRWQVSEYAPWDRHSSSSSSAPLLLGTADAVVAERAGIA